MWVTVKGPDQCVVRLVVFPRRVAVRIVTLSPTANGNGRDFGGG